MSLARTQNGAEVTSRLKLNVVLSCLTGAPRFRQVWTARTTWENFDNGQDFVSCQIRHKESSYFVVARWLTPWPEHEMVRIKNQNRSLTLTISYDLPETLTLRWVDVEIIHGFRGLIPAIEDLQRRTSNKHPK